MNIDKVYVVATEENDDGDIYTDVLDGKFYTDRDEARKAMIADFDRTKSDFDECDDIDEWHDLDCCRLSANLMRSFEWEVVELTKGGK